MTSLTRGYSPKHTPATCLCTVNVMLTPQQHCTQLVKCCLLGFRPSDYNRLPHDRCVAAQAAVLMPGIKTGFTSVPPPAASHGNWLNVRPWKTKGKHDIGDNKISQYITYNKNNLLKSYLWLNQCLVPNSNGAIASTLTKIYGITIMPGLSIETYLFCAQYSNTNSVLKIRTICHARDLLKLAWSYKQCVYYVMYWLDLSWFKQANTVL